MSEFDALFVPPERLKDVRRWTPATLTEQPTTPDRRSATERARDAAVAVSREAADHASSLRAAESIRLSEVHKQAQAAGYHAGLSEGQAFAHAQGLQLQAVVAQAQAAITGIEESIAEQLLQLAIDLARQVIRTEISMHRTSMLPVVQEALRAVPEGTLNGELLLNAEDVELVRAHLSEELALGAWRVVSDSSVERGGCKVVTRSCDVDASLRARWQRAMQVLGRKEPWTTA